MIRIEIEEECVSPYEMVDVLNTIATMVKQGYTSGYNPNWKLVGEDDQDIGDDDDEG